VRGRAWLWLAAVLALVAAARAGDESLSAHMVQHGLLTMVAAPLLAAAAPVRTVLGLASPAARRGIGALLRRPAVRAIGHPLVGWTLLVTVMAATHLTGFYDFAERHATVHALEHGLYLGSALLFWMPVVGADPLPHRLGWLGRTIAVMAAMPPMIAIGVALRTSEHVRYASYAGPGALADQHEAGTIMWLGGALMGAALVLAVGWAALVGEERRQRAREATEAAR
jgi:putative membrane protein